MNFSSLTISPQLPCVTRILLNEQPAILEENIHSHRVTLESQGLIAIFCPNAVICRL